MKHSSPRPIVCGTDFSQNALEAANVAAALAKRVNAPLMLVHGVDERGEIFPKHWPALESDARPRLVAEAVRLRTLGADVDERVAGGVPDEGVAVSAERADARLIVLAASGQGTLGRWLLGSVSENIAETAWVPTLVLRETERIQDWAKGGKTLRVFVAADFTEQSNAALAWASELHTFGPCEFTVGYVDRMAERRAEEAVHAPTDWPKPSEMQQMLEHDLRERAAGFLPADGVRIRVLPTSGHVEEHLLEMAHAACADLIVIGTHQWRGLSRLRHPSVSRRLLHQAHVSVACVPTHHAVSANTPCVAQARHVIVATDLKTHGSAALPYAFSMMQLGATAWLLHVAKPGEDHAKLTTHLSELIPVEAERLGFKVETRIVEGVDVASRICEIAKGIAADLICIGARGGKRDPSSVAHEVINRSTCPVLVVPQTDF